MKINETLKKFRKDKGLTQQEMCGNIITASYYSKVESGAHRLTAEDLFLILDRNNIAITDFFEKLNFTTKVRYSYDLYESQIMRASYIGDFKALSRIISDLEEEDFPDKDILLLNAKLTKASIMRDYSILTSNEMQTIKYKVFSRENWDICSLFLFSKSLHIFYVEDIILIMRNIFKNYKEEMKEDKELEIILMVTATNYVMECIKQNKDEFAPEYIFFLNDIIPVPETVCCKLITIFLENLIVFRNNQLTTYENNIDYVIGVFHRIHMSEYADLLQDFFDEYKIRIK